MEHGQMRALQRALGLTLASAVIWGVAHLWAGRRITGALLAAAFAAIAAALIVLATGFRHDLLDLVVQPTWLTAIIVATLGLALIWVTVVVRSWLLVRPSGLAVAPRAAGIAAVVGLCLAVTAPFAYAAHSTYVYRDALTTIFKAGKNQPKVHKDNPWQGRPRLNVLLLGGDSGSNRVGVRTDSVTLASIDTKTGDTVLLGLPRNLQQVAMPPGPAADRFPNGFTGDGPETPGLLNEIFEYGEEHPEILPGVAKGERGPALLVPTVSQILGQPIDYYILVDMKGFAQIVDAMGGVYLRIPKDIVFGKYNEGLLKAGYRKLNGTDSLWYGRSRTDSDDYVRMGRQKCLLRAIARQADPQKVLLRFQKLAVAAKHTISTDIPQNLLPALIDLSGQMKSGAKINSLQFVPPLISTGNPDFALIRERSAKAIASSQNHQAAAPTQTTPASPTKTVKHQTDPTAGPADTAGKPLSLDATCPS
ncbi:MAG: LCP family protein [Streptosporangiaceae bacterium]